MFKYVKLCPSALEKASKNDPKRGSVGKINRKQLLAKNCIVVLRTEK